MGRLARKGAEMKRLLFAAFLAVVALPAQAQQARVVTTCGSLAPFGPNVAGTSALPTVDVNGKLCLSGGGGGGSIVGGTTPVTGTCPSGQFLYNNAGVVGCSASSTSIVLPQTISGTVNSGGIPYFNSTTQMSSSALLANNAVMLGGGAAASPKTTTTGTGVVTALGVNTNAAGGVALVNTVPTNGNLVKWSATGLVDGGAGSSTITAGTTPTSGFTAGQALYSDGSLTQAAGSYYSANASSQRNGVNAQTERVYNTYTDASNGEWGTFDWTTTANVLTIGTQYNGTGASRSINIVNGAQSILDYGITHAGWVSLGGAAGIAPTGGGSGYNGYSTWPWAFVFSNAFISAGTSPTIAGSGGTCATTTKVGGPTAGTVVLSAVCASTNTIVWTGLPASTNGWACDAVDRTTRTAGPFIESASTTTGFTLTVGATSSVANDVLQWKCIGY
jgi:hypothetical protein